MGQCKRQIINLAETLSFSKNSWVFPLVLKLFPSVFRVSWPWILFQNTQRKSLGQGNRGLIWRLFASLKLVEAVLIRHTIISRCCLHFSPAKQFIMFSFLVQEKMKGFAGGGGVYDSYIYIYCNLFLFGMLYLTAFFATALTGFHKYFFLHKSRQPIFHTVVSVWKNVKSQSQHWLACWELTVWCTFETKETICFTSVCVVFYMYNIKIHTR